MAGQDQDGNGSLCGEAVASWYSGTTAPGRPEQGWICPSAPVRKRPIPSVPVSVDGTVNSAWVIYNGPAGSYGVNYWFTDRLHWPDQNLVAVLPSDFTRETEVVKPWLTPLLADAVWCFIGWIQPTALPPGNLVTGLPLGDGTRPSSSFVGGYMWEVALPRHGSRPNPVPTKWRMDRPLPGAVNVAFFDGHVATLKPDQLWQLYWGKTYVPPAKRPGLH